jgi:hypothetical protein
MLVIVLPAYPQIEYFKNHQEEGEMAEENAAALAHGSPPAGGEGLSADAFRGLVTAFKDAQMQRGQMSKPALSSDAAS